MSYSKILLYFCVSFIVGIFIYSFIFPLFISEQNGNFEKILILYCLILGIGLICVFWDKKDIVIIGFCFIFLAAGIFWNFRADVLIINNQLSFLNNQDNEIILIGTICSEPDVREEHTKITFNITEIKNIRARKEADENNSYSKNFNKNRTLIIGKVLITTHKYPEYQYGDELKIKGRLESPPVFDGFNYQDYLAKHGIYSVMRYPNIELIDRGNYTKIADKIFAQILVFKNKLRETIEQNISPPQSLILGAIILGDKNKISNQWNQKLNIAGVRHITCISGMHIVILSELLILFGIGIGLYRGQAFYFSIGLLTLFIIMIGMPSSAVRAGIMAGLFLFAQKIGRFSWSDRAIVFAGTIMLIHNPLLLSADIGFQLSFLAVLGIIYLTPMFQDKLKKIHPGFLRDIIAMALSAQIFTLPILIHNFGYMSLVSVFTNLLIAPVLPFILGFGFLFVLTGTFSLFFAWLLSMPCYLLITYIIKIVDLFSSLPYAVLNLKISWIFILFYYAALILAVWFIYQKQKLKFLDC